MTTKALKGLKRRTFLLSSFLILGIIFIFCSSVGAWVTQFDGNTTPAWDSSYASTDANGWEWVPYSGGLLQRGGACNGSGASYALKAKQISVVDTTEGQFRLQYRSEGIGTAYSTQAIIVRTGAWTAQNFYDDYSTDGVWNSGTVLVHSRETDTVGIHNGVMQTEILPSTANFSTNGQTVVTVCFVSVAYIGCCSNMFLDYLDFNEPLLGGTIPTVTNTPIQQATSTNTPVIVNTPTPNPTSNFEVNVSSASGCAGSSIIIDLLLKNNEQRSISAWGVTVNYDTTKLTFEGKDDSGTLCNGWLFIDANERTPGKIIIGGANTTPINNQNGALLHLNFTIKSTAQAGVTSLVPSDYTDDVETATGSPGSVTINASCSNISVNVQSTSGTPGSPVVVNILLSNPDTTTVQAFGMTLSYDTNNLTYNSVDKTGTLTASWIQVGGNETTPGQVNIGGFDTTGTNATSGTLIKVVFDAKLSAVGTSNISLGTFLDAFSGANSQAGQVTFGAPQCVPTTPAPCGDPGVNLTSVLNVIAGQNITIEVTLANNGAANINAYGAELAYDTTYLTYVNTDKTGTLTASWIQSAGNEPTAGTIRLGGFDTTGTSAATGSLIKVNFTVASDISGMCCSVLTLSSLTDSIASFCAGTGVICKTVQQAATPTPTSAPTVPQCNPVTPAPCGDPGVNPSSVLNIEAGQSITVDILLANNGAEAINAYGAELIYDTTYLTYVNTDKTGTLTASWIQSAGNEPTAGTIRLGGFDTTGTSATSGTLIKVNFTVANDISDMCCTTLTLGSLTDSIASFCAGTGAVCKKSGPPPTQRAEVINWEVYK